MGILLTLVTCILNLISMRNKKVFSPGEGDFAVLCEDAEILELIAEQTLNEV